MSRSAIRRLSTSRFTTLGWLAGVTRRIEIGTTVIVLPYRNPLEVARMAANVDQLSGGRLLFGVGVGWAAQDLPS
jgi:alkanesulfonate monooxygenase SsuD/methylene tetrahydromethanopterin reductase-like flavin-dependent oxidoreductase (luciferase family)